ncbi:GDP-mannose 4,6-dehydratase [candidate division KSB1 bacterium]|nr:GDP-mannose 4,6-dehydratase [candidate division KSB1 bacterium]
MKILLTGGAGFIGSHLGERLLKDGYSVVCLDNFDDFYDPTVKRDNISSSLENPQYELVEGDIRDENLLIRTFEKTPFDVVIHLAARAGVRPSIANPSLYASVNVDGTIKLLETMRRFPIKKFIFGSSSSVYGNNSKIPFSESDPVDHPISPYAATKRAGELLCYTYHQLYHIPTACVRFFTVYGSRQRPEMAIHKFTELMHRDKEISMYGDGTTKRDYTYIDDIIDGIMGIFNSDFSFEIINLGESQTVELKRLIQLIEHHLGKRAKIKLLPPQPGDVNITYADISKAREKFGYSPNTPIEKGIALFVEWFKNQHASARG